MASEAPDLPTISELFATDPLQLTQPDITRIVAYYRENRAKFIAGGKAPREAKAPKVKADVPALDLDLGDL